MSKGRDLLSFHVKVVKQSTSTLYIFFFFAGTCWMDRIKAEYLYYDKSSPVRYGSKTKMLRYLRNELKMGNISRKQFIESVKGVIALAKEIDLGTHFQRHRKKLGIFHYSLYPNKNQYFQMDLMDLSSYAKYNRGFKWILIFINAQTKYLRIYIMKNKNAKEVSNAVYNILTKIKDLKKAKYRILIQSDDGKEFFNKEMRSVLVSFNNIGIYSTASEHKAAFAESVIWTIRGPLVRSMEDNGPTWIDQLPDIVHNYNNNYHSTIKMSPSEAEENFPLALTNILTRRDSVPAKDFTPKFRKGDHVRIFAKNPKAHFRKGSLRKWTAEVFTISEVRRLSTKYIYKLKDRKGEHLTGTFDENDLQPAKTQSVYKYHVLDTRKRKGLTEYYVHWDGFPSSDNEWVKESDLL